LPPVSNREWGSSAVATGNPLGIRVRTIALAAGLLLLLGLASGRAAAADSCSAVALMTIPDWGDGDPADSRGNLLIKGQVDDAITQYLVNRKTGNAVFCSHGGYCYPRYLTVDGQKVEALRLTNCKIGAVETGFTGNGDDTITYDVDIDRSKASTATLKYDDLDNALLALGMCNACADNAADIYLKHPESRCGATVAAALAGNKQAIAALQAGPDYCTEDAATAAAPAAMPATAAAAPAATPTAGGASSTRVAQPPAAVRSHGLGLFKTALILAAMLYFVPTLVGYLRKKRNLAAIFTLNLLLGWTFLGWVGALLWSLIRDRPD
jgi:hypothetical protein